MRKRRRVTNHFAIEKCTPAFHQAEENATDLDRFLDLKRKATSHRLEAFARRPSRAPKPGSPVSPVLACWGAGNPERSRGILNV
jgi:hypothetical protein